MPLLETFANASVRGWNPGVSGPSSAYELITTTTLGSAAGSVTFSGLNTSAAAYKHLQLRYSIRDSSASNFVTSFSMRFNSDTGANYSKHSLRGNGTGTTSNGAGGVTALEVGMEAGGGMTANIFAGGIIDILDFASSTKNTTVRSLSGVPGTGPYIALMAGAWFSTAAVTSILLENYGVNFVSGSRFSLYGLKG